MTSPLLADLRRLATGRLRPVLANTVWLYVDRLIGIPVALAASVLVVRYLGPEAYGTLHYAIALVALFTPLATVGVDAIAVRELVRTPERRAEILGSAAVLRLGGGLVGWAGALLVAWVLRPHPLVIVLVAILGAALPAHAFSAADLWLQAELRAKLSTISRNAALLLASLLKVALVVTGGSLVGFAIAYALEPVAWALLLLVAAHLAGASPRHWRATLPQVQSLFRDAWPLLVSGLSIMAYMHIDKVMLGSMRGEQVVGIYAVAVLLSEVLYFIPQGLTASTYPMIVRAGKRPDDPAAREARQTYFDIISLVSYAIVVPLVLVADPLVLLVFGEAYADSAAIVVVHAWSFFFVAFGLGRGRWILPLNMVRFAMVSTLLGAGVNIALNLLLIPGWGALGAAWATLVSYGVQGYLSSLLLPSLRPMFREMSLALLAPVRLPQILRSVRRLS